MIVCEMISKNQCENVSSVHQINGTNKEHTVCLYICLCMSLLSKLKNIIALNELKCIKNCMQRIPRKRKWFDEEDEGCIVLD